MSAHQGWWPSAPSTKPKTTLPPSSPLRIPPQTLWPHHACLAANSSSPIIPAAIQNDDTREQIKNHQSSTTPYSTSVAEKHDDHRQVDEERKDEIYPIRPLYAGIFLSGPSKHRILDRYPPHHATVYAHHVTLHYFGYDGISESDVENCFQHFPLGATVAISIIGSAADERCQALEVTLPSWVPYDNSTVPPHVTVSVVEGGEAREAGQLIKERKTQGEIEPVHGLRVLHGIVGICMTDRNIVYSEEELRNAIKLSDHNKSGHGSGDDDDSASSGEQCKEEGLPLCPPQPSSDLMSQVMPSLEKEKNDRTDENCNTTRTSSTNCTTITTVVDLVSLMHQCFTPVPSVLLPPQPLLSGVGAPMEGETTSLHSLDFSVAPPAAADSVYSSSTTQSNNNRRRLNSLQQQQQNLSRPSSRNLNTSTSQSKRRSTTAAAAAGGAWWKTSSSVRVRANKQNTTCSGTILDQEQQTEQTETQSYGLKIKIDNTSIDGAACSTAAPQFHSNSEDHAFKLNLEAAENERATMHVHHTAYKTALSTSKRAKSIGNHTSARKHAAVAHRHASVFLAARQRSSAAAFHAHNAAILNTFKLDLHGMHVKEALAVLRKYVDLLSELGAPGGILLKVVTGFGQHSQIPGRAKVLPAVVEYLAEMGFLFDVEEENPGMVRVLLEPQWSV